MSSVHRLQPQSVLHLAVPDSADLTSGKLCSKPAGRGSWTECIDTSNLFLSYGNHHRCNRTDHLTVPVLTEVLRTGLDRWFRKGLKENRKQKCTYHVTIVTIIASIQKEHPSGVLFLLDVFALFQASSLLCYCLLRTLFLFFSVLIWRGSHMLFKEREEIILC